MNQPFFDSVPLPSVVVFAALWPMSLAFCRPALRRPPRRGRQNFSGSAVAVAHSHCRRAGLDRHRGPTAARHDRGRAIAQHHRGRDHLRAELAVLAVVATVVLINQWRRSRRADDSEAVRYSNPQSSATPPPTSRS